jgi:hypothetical protein
MSVGNDNKHVGLPWDASWDEFLVNGVLMRAANNCPMCGWETKQILYGLPADRNAASDEVVLGGCVIDDLSPELTCSNCDWSGQKWHASAPLPPTVWLIMDPDRLLPSIGVTTERFDSVLEVYLFGHWHNITFTKQYEDWLSLLGGKPLVFSALFGDLSPALIADLRIGNYRFEPQELLEAGFVQTVTEAPKFEFDGRMEKLEH